MSKPVEISTTLHITAPAGHTVMADSQAVLREKTDRYIAGLLAGLGIPGKAVVHWEQQAAGKNTVELFVNEKPARLRHTTADSAGVNPADFVQALGEDILRNRALLITETLIGYVAGRAHVSFQRFPEKDRARILHILFAQGFGLQRLESYAPPADTPDHTPDAWAEACIGDLEACRFLMYAHAAQIDPDDNPHDFNRLVEGADYFVDVAFKIKGIPFPKMRSIKRDDFDPEEMAFQVNDLLFPIRRIGDVAAENLRFVNFLTSNGVLFLNRGSIDFLLDSLEPANPNLLALVRSRFPTDFIVAVLRNLAAENISVRPLARILEILVSGGQDVYRQQTGVSEAPPLSETIHLAATDKGPEQLDIADWSELVRINLKNAVINRALPHFEEPQAISCFFLENALLDEIARFDTLAAARQEALRRTLHRQIAEAYLTPAGKIRPVITSAAWRKKIGELIAFEFPDTPVFSLQECLPRIVARFDRMIVAE